VFSLGLHPPRHSRRGAQGASGVMITATLSGDDTREADGFTAVGYAPALDLCRLLVAAGRDPSTPMQVFRDGVLSLRIRSIGEGAGLCVKDSSEGSPRFRRKAPPTLSLGRDIAKSAGVAISPPTASKGLPA
jgi:hypothetical protein